MPSFSFGGLVACRQRDEVTLRRHYLAQLVTLGVNRLNAFSDCQRRHDWALYQCLSFDIPKAMRPMRRYTSWRHSLFADK